MDYKCKKIRNRNADWERLASGNSFQGICMHSSYVQCSWSSLSSYCIGCPVREKSCNSSSEVPDENNILSIETARDIKECAGQLKTLINLGLGHLFHSFVKSLTIYSIYFTLLFRDLSRNPEQWNVFQWHKYLLLWVLDILSKIIQMLHLGLLQRKWWPWSRKWK